MKTFTRRAGAIVLTGALTGLAAIAAAVVPIDLPTDAAGQRTDAAEAGRDQAAKPESPGKPGKDGGGSTGGAIPADADVLLAGASVKSIYPNPPEGERWETDYDACAILAPATLERLAGGSFELTDHIASTGSPWPENPDCIYMGGYGIGPMFPITEVDEAAALYVRSFAAIDDQGDAAVMTVVDGEGWFWDYASKCDDCGSKEIAAAMADELGIDASGIVIAATHSHTSPDFIGGWGHVPDWYMAQVTTAIKDSIREAVTTAAPAVIEIGEVEARRHNRERRDTYRSAEEQQATWFRALAVQDGQFLVDEETGAPQTIATVGAYAAHPVTRDHDTGVAHADWPGLFEDRIEDRFGGIGFHFMTGLGNISPAGGTEMGTRLADELPEIGAGDILTNTDIVSAQTTWRHPATNVPLTALAMPGFFDHPIDPIPAEVRTGPEPETAPCASQSAVSAEVPASAIFIGPDLAITASPGEIFSNFSNTVKEKSGAKVTMPLGQANDALGYMPQSFELNPVGQQGLGFAAGGFLFVNYEDSYAIDRCFGDMALETTLGMLGSLRSNF